MKQFIQQLFLLIAAFAFLESVSYAQQILEPGVPYIVREYVSNGDTFGIHGPEYHSFEITIYKDGSACGVFSVGLHDYDEEDAYRFKMTGDWRNTTQYDKKVVRIFLNYEDNHDNYLSYTIYVDDAQKAYLSDLNNKPSQLYKKSELLAEKIAKEQEVIKQAEREAQDAKMEAEQKAIRQAKREANEKEYYSLMKQSKVLYEIIDLGLSVKWANVNLVRAFYDDSFWDKLWSVGPIDQAQLDNLDGSLGHTHRMYKLNMRNEMPQYLFYKDQAGEVKKRPFVDIDSTYVAGGSKHGYPVRYLGSDDIERALMLSLKYTPNPSLNTPQEQENWAKTYAKLGHYPTKAEWQELMDNCTVTGVEINPARNNPISLAYYNDTNRDKDEYLSVKMLRLTSKVNGKSIVLPFDSRNGTNYATSQYLSSDPNEVTCVHVDANGLTFLEVNREEKIAHRCAFGDINMASLESDIQAARAQYPHSPYALEQHRLRDEYDNHLKEGMLSIGAPIITVQVADNRRYLEIKAPVISGEITSNSMVLVALDTNIPEGDRYDVRSLVKATIQKSDGSNPAYIILSSPMATRVKETNPKTGEPITTHQVFFISDNYMSRLDDKEIRTLKDFNQFLTTFKYDSNNKIKKNYYYDPLTGFNNSYDLETSRRLIATPTTYFRISSDNIVEYESGPSPIPQIGREKQR